MEMNIVQVNSAAFTHFPESKRLVADISDIAVREFQKLYNDAADVGFALRNPKTGNVTRWQVASEVRGPYDGELHGWYLVPTSESLRRNPQMEGYCITLVND
jgi:hypothetical protein